MTIILDHQFVIIVEVTGDIAEFFKKKYIQTGRIWTLGIIFPILTDGAAEAEQGTPLHTDLMKLIKYIASNSDDHDTTGFFAYTL